MVFPVIVIAKLGGSDVGEAVDQKDLIQFPAWVIRGPHLQTPLLKASLTVSYLGFCFQTPHNTISSADIF